MNSLGLLAISLERAVESGSVSMSSHNAKSMSSRSKSSPVFELDATGTDVRSVRTFFAIRPLECLLLWVGIAVVYMGSVTTTM